MIGQTVSHYRIVEKLGAGGMGIVWKARDMRLDRFVALKFLPPEKISDPERKRRFVHEAKAASALNHPHIITIYDIDQASGADFIAMEYVPGNTLDQSIPHSGLRLEPALDYAIQVADALAAAHAAGIVHRDLKPANVMVGDSGAIKVLDFGLAKLTEHDGSSDAAPTLTMTKTSATAEGIIVGTASYMSPEQAEGKKVDARSDIFSFGAVLYQMITGRRAFAGDSMLSVLTAILRDQPKPAAEIVDGIPRELDRIVARCLQKDPGRRYQHAGDLKIDLQQVKEDLASSVPVLRQEKPPKPTAFGWWFAAMIACVAVSFAIGWRLHAPSPAPLWRLTRLTTDTGLSGFPALSPDGKLVAYSSDRSVDGQRDLYVKQVSGGQPIRLTFDGAGNTTPDFSPDGSKVVFRSNRDGGGIYEVPAFGGDIRLVAREGFNPKISPDGSQVAYWVGAETVSPLIPGGGMIWLVPAAGGQPRRLASNLTSARYPIWSPDGKHLLCIGYSSAKIYESAAIDWWLVPTNGDSAVKTGAYEALIRAKLRTPNSIDGGPEPACWLPGNNGVTFSIAGGDSQNLWEIGIAPRTGEVTGALRRLTTGAGNELNASCSSSGALTFTNAETRRDLWLLPFDLDHGTPKGPLSRITGNPGIREHASLSGNGNLLVYASNQSGRFNIWMRNLATGKESSLSSSPLIQRYAVINRSGTRIAYSGFENDKRSVFVAAPGGASENLCEGCLRATDWSRDEKTLLIFAGIPYQVDLLDVASHRRTVLFKHPEFNLLFAHFSPDNRWVSFTARTQPNRARLVIAPITGAKPVPESEWITIAEEDTQDWANWSPDGKTLYFTSQRDGHYCLWGQRIDGVTHRPVGGAFAAQHLHGRVSYTQQGWAAGEAQVILVLTETAGNIWAMSQATP